MPPPTHPHTPGETMGRRPPHLPQDVVRAILGRAELPIDTRLAFGVPPKRVALPAGIERIRRVLLTRQRSPLNLGGVHITRHVDDARDIALHLHWQCGRLMYAVEVTRCVVRPPPSAEIELSTLRYHDYDWATGAEHRVSYLTPR